MNDVGNNGTIVRYGINELRFTAFGTAEKFMDGGTNQRVQYIHRVSSKYIHKNNYSPHKSLN